MNDPVLQTARQRLADMYPQPYTKRAILRGEWDTGILIKGMVEQVERELLAAPVESDEG